MLAAVLVAVVVVW